MELVGVALDRDAARRARLEPVAVGDRRDLLERLRGDLGEVAFDARAGAAGVGAGEQQQVADEAVHPLRAAQRRGDGRALVLVGVAPSATPRAARGWRGCSSAACAARARRRRRTRAGAGSSPRSPIGRRRAAQHLVERAGELGDLVVALRLGDPARGIAGRRDVARAVGSAPRSAASPGWRPPCRRAPASSVPTRRRRRGTARGARSFVDGRSGAGVLDVDGGAPDDRS